MPFSRIRKNNETVELNDVTTVQTIQQHIENINLKTANALNNWVDNFDAYCNWAKVCKWDAIENMANYLELFEENWINNQAETNNHNKIYWANTTNEANRVIENIIKKKRINTAITLPSAELLELEIEALLKRNKVEEKQGFWEHHLQYFLREDKHHPLFPLIHKSTEYCNRYINEVFSADENPLSYWADEHKVSITSTSPKETIGIVHAHYLCPDLGSVVWLDNEGAYGQVVQQCDTIIVLAGIDRIISSSKDLDLLAGLQSTFAIGEQQNNTLHLLSNVRKNQQVIVVLIDNARTELLKAPKWRPLLYDLDGICWLNQCHDFPFLKPENYHPYHFGPISAILTSLMYDDSGLISNHTFWADVQESFLPHPFKLNFKELLLSLRNELQNSTVVNLNSIHNYWDAHEKAYKGNLGVGKWMLKRKLKKVLGKNNEPLKMAKTSFLDEWEAMKNSKK